MIASQVRIHLINAELMGEFYFKKDPVALAQRLFREGCYTAVGEFAVQGQEQDAAEEVFDLTNNPSRQEEREQLYGRGRSVSVGDIIQVEDEFFLCASMGWKSLDIVAV
jgi:hypothetical protein